MVLTVGDFDRIEKLRNKFRQHVGIHRKKLFELKENGLAFVFNRLSVNKIGCIKSIMNSLKNGFTPEDHFKAADRIKELFEHSIVIEQHYETKKIRTETHYLCLCKTEENIYVYMSVVTWGKGEGYIDLYLSKDGE